MNGWIPSLITGWQWLYVATECPSNRWETGTVRTTGTYNPSSNSRDQAWPSCSTCPTPGSVKCEYEWECSCQSRLSVGLAGPCCEHSRIGTQVGDAPEPNGAPGPEQACGPVYSRFVPALAQRYWHQSGHGSIFILRCGMVGHPTIHSHQQCGLR